MRSSQGVEGRRARLSWRVLVAVVTVGTIAAAATLGLRAYLGR